jgi:hypothetical protein
MRNRLILAAVAATALTAFPAAAQDGQHGEALASMLTQVATGTCPADLMTGELLTVCQQQISAMGPGLASLGPIQSKTFVRVQTTPEGPVEIWRVQFERMALNWGIGGFQDGKFSITYSAPAES